MVALANPLVGLFFQALAYVMARRRG